MFSSECANLELLAVIGTEICKPPPANEFGELRYFVHKARSTEYVCRWPVRIVFISTFYLPSGFANGLSVPSRRTDVMRVRGVR
jgi:hypothetical protein